MTRRDLFARAALASASGYVSCAAYPQSVRRWLENAEERDGIMIVGFGLWALTLHGKPAGRLTLPDCCIAPPSISPDGNCVVWIPNSSLPYPVGKSEPVLKVRRWGSAIETIHYRARFADWVAASSGSSIISVVAAAVDQPGRKLLILRGDTGEIQCDLTSLIAGFPTNEIEQLDLSASGTRLTLGTRTEFVVIDIPSQSVLQRRAGRFPTVSPTNSRIAFVDRRQLLLLDLDGGDSHPRELAVGRSVYGVGAWSPDGRMLLAGIQPTASLSAPLESQLVAIDTRSAEWASIAKLQEGDYGNRCRWIARRLLNI